MSTTQLPTETIGHRPTDIMLAGVILHWISNEAANGNKLVDNIEVVVLYRNLASDTMRIRIFRQHLLGFALTYD